MNKWEYYTDLYSNKAMMDIDDAVLNARGREGWELICVIKVNAREAGEQKDWLVVFKRQLLEEDNQ